MIAPVMPQFLHTASSSRSALGYSVGGAFGGGIGGPGGWWILDEPELHLGGNIIVPGLTGWRRERMPPLPATAWFKLAPDWVCGKFVWNEFGPPEAGPKGEPQGWGEQILSPSTARIDRAVKMPLYAREGVPHLWLVDPDARTLEVYHLQNDGHWLLLDTLKDDDPVKQPPFDAVTFSLEGLWG